MKLIKKILIFTFSFVFLSSTLWVHFCPATGSFSTETVPSFYLSEPSQNHHHDESPCESKCDENIPCQQNHSCCHSIAQNKEIVLFLLSYHSFNPEQILFP